LRRVAIASAAAATCALIGPAPVAAAVTFQHAANLVWFSPTVDQRVIDDQLDNMQALGINTVALNVWWFQNNISSTTIAPDFSRYSSTDDTLRQVIDAAHARGLAVQLRPLVDLSNDSSHWRGQITGGTTWFNGAGGYGDYIRHMADIAQAKNVESFGVGVELEATASQETLWRNLITSVRTHYSGPLTYSANWGNPAVGSTINWWNAVDYMGIDAYYPLTGVSNPTPAQLQSAWTTRAAQIDSYHNSINPNQPLLFTESGYQNYDGTNIAPYNGVSGQANDPHEQADCYTALLGAMTQRSYFQGVQWWAFDLNPNPNNIDYTPLGKLAQDAMAAYYIPGYTLGPSWNGSGGNNWSTGSSWSNGTAPGNLTTANFTSAGGGTTTINLGGNVTIARLIFDTSSVAAYSFAAGNTITFNAGGGVTVTDSVTNSQTISSNLALQGHTIFANQSNAVITVNGSITGATAGLKRLTLMYNGGGSLNGSISDGAGTIAIFKAGNGTWTLGGNNSYSGETDIFGGNLKLTNNNALGSTTGGTVIGNAASLQLNPNIAISNEPLELTGIGSGGQGALQLLDGGGSGSWTGPITVVGGGQIANRSFNGSGTANFTIGGKISGGSSTGSVTFRGSNSSPGFFRLTGSGSDYLGGTYVWGTKVILAGGTNTLPPTTVVDLDTLSRAASLDSGVLDLNGNNQTLAGLTNHVASTPARVVNRAGGSTATLTINSNAGASITYAGGILDDVGHIAVVKTGTGTQILSGSSSYTAGTSVSGGTLVASHVNALGTGSLVATGGMTKFTAGFTAAVKVAGISVSAPAQVDLSDNDMVIDYGGATPLSSIGSFIATGYANGSWNGPGMNSSSAATNNAMPGAHLTALGFAEASEAGYSGGTFSGVGVDATAVVIRYTLAGDANVSGSVDLTDFTYLAANFNASNQTWLHGDFNYDGSVDLTDFSMLAANFSLTQPAGVIGATVPEPVILGIAPVTLVAGLRRRRCLVPSPLAGEG
jgi:autotransporter-associated beta strand protein